MKWLLWPIFYCLFIVFIGSAWAAQTFTIPLGTTTYGPFSVTTLHKYAEVLIDKTLWTDPNRIMMATFYVSTDKAKTWVVLGEFNAHGGGDPPLTVQFARPLPTNATNIQIVTVVTGGAITVSQLPVVHGK